MIRITFAAAAIAAGALAFAGPAAAAPWDTGIGMDDMKYAVEIASTPPRTDPVCTDGDDPYCVEMCEDTNNDFVCDSDSSGDAPDIPPASPPSPYEP